MQRALFPFLLILSSASFAQTNLVTYAGGGGNEVFNDVVQLSNGHVLVIGVADDLSWIAGGVPQYTLGTTGITNNLGTNRIPFIIVFDSTLQNMLAVHHLPQGAAEDLRFIKLSNAPGTPTGDLYLSGNTEDSNTGGYFIGKLDNNFVNGDPTGFEWVSNVKCTAGGYPKTLQPWDVGSDGKVVYAYGDSHDYNWSAMYRTNADGTDGVVPHWRVHWPTGGGEFHGDGPDYSGGLAGLDYSAIVFKRDPVRCELRSHSQADYEYWQPDGNGGTKKGKWPLDVLYDSPCDPLLNTNTTNGPGYTGYSPGATFTYGPSSVCIDRRTNNMYIGFNAKSVLPSNEPDFEPAVMAMDPDGSLLWWSRLYHEVTPAGDTMVSEPDQYIDALAIDYSQPPANGLLVVNARCHGNNTENFWQGNVIAANPGASGFQNQFTGSTGNIHISWLGKLTLANGTLMHSTFAAELAEGATGLGTPHADPNIDGWPDPNTGWPTLNTTYLGKNNLKVTADGSVLVLGKGRRTITTANAFEKMVKPGNGGLSCWNDFARVYTNDLSTLKYSSLIVGQWDTLTQQGGDNVRLYGSFKNAHGAIVVGKHTGTGNEMPTANIPSWGNANFNGESAVLAYLQPTNLYDPNDDPVDVSTAVASIDPSVDLLVWPNPANDAVNVRLPDDADGTVRLLDLCGRALAARIVKGMGALSIPLEHVASGSYMVEWRSGKGALRTKRLVVR